MYSPSDFEEFDLVKKKQTLLVRQNQTSLLVRHFFFFATVSMKNMRGRLIYIVG